MQRTCHIKLTLVVFSCLHKNYTNIETEIESLFDLCLSLRFYLLFKSRGQLIGQYKSI